MVISYPVFTQQVYIYVCIRIFIYVHKWMTATNWHFQHHLHVFTGRCANTQDMQVCIQTCLNCPTLPISLILPCLSMTVWSICLCASMLNINGTLNAVSFVNAYTHVFWRGCARTYVAEVYKLISIRYCLFPPLSGLRFSEVLALVHQFYSSLDALLVGLPSRFVALCGNSSLQWYVTDFACILRGVPTVSVWVAGWVGGW